MNTIFNKKIVLDDEMKADFTSLLIETSEKEQQKEEQLESTKENHKATVKSIESETLDLINERRSYERILKQGFKEEEVPCKKFTDSETYKRITIELETLELLQVEDINRHANLSLEFDDFNIVKCNQEKFELLLNENPEIFGEIPNEIIDINIKLYLYAFGTDESMRLIKLTDGFDFDELKAVIFQYNLDNQQEPAQLELT